MQDIKAAIAALATTEAGDSASLRQSSIERARELTDRPGRGSDETTQTFETVLLSTLTDDAELGDEDFAFMQEVLTFAYTRDFLDEQSLDYHRAKLIYGMAREQDWRSDEWTRHLRSFVRTCRWAEFTPAEFFKAERVALHDYLWYCKRIEESRANAELIGAYRVDGRDKPMYGWKAAIGDRLPLVTPPDTKALPAPRPAPQGMPSEIREEWDATKRVLEAEGAVDQLTKQRNQAYRDTEMYRKRAERAEEQVDALQRRVRVLTERNAVLAERVTKLAKRLGIEVERDTESGDAATHDA